MEIHTLKIEDMKHTEGKFIVVRYDDEEEGKINFSRRKKKH